MSILNDCIRSDTEYRHFLTTLERDFRASPLPILASGLCDGAAEAFLVSTLEDSRRFRGGTALIICPEEKDCVRTCATLERNGISAAFYLSRDLTFYNITASHEYEHERLRVLSGILSNDYEVVVTTPDAALSYTVSPERLRAGMIEVSDTDSIDPQAFAKKLISLGYARVDLVDSPGQFALRGDIVDIFPPHGCFTDEDGGEKNGAFALRIELFGDEIDRMGIFDPETQRMIQSVTLTHFPPAREILPDKDALERLINRR